MRSTPRPWTFPSTRLIEVQAHLNNFLDAKAGVDNIGTGVVSASENWWGCAGGPTANGCAVIGGTKSLICALADRAVLERLNSRLG